MVAAVVLLLDTTVTVTVTATGMFTDYFGIHSYYRITRTAGEGFFSLMWNCSETETEIVLSLSLFWFEQGIDALCDQVERIDRGEQIFGERCFDWDETVFR